MRGLSRDIRQPASSRVVGRIDSVDWLKMHRANHGQRLETPFSIQLSSESRFIRPSVADEYVCLSQNRLGRICVVMDRPMATSQDFVNWVCSQDAQLRVPEYLFVAERRASQIRERGDSSTIYFPKSRPSMSATRRSPNNSGSSASSTKRLRHCHRQSQRREEPSIRPRPLRKPPPVRLHPARRGMGEEARLEDVGRTQTGSTANGPLTRRSTRDVIPFVKPVDFVTTARWTTVHDG